ncbi:MAG: phosphoribosylglycinamide formyltransferase [Blastocatellia bacterium]
MKRIGILISGRGSNMEALAEAVHAERVPGAEIAVVISNVASAGGLKRARERGIDTVTLDHRGRTREEHDRAMAAALRAREVDLICLAGYMRLLSPWFTREFPNRILNVHPSLLPAFPGLDAQRQAIEYGVKFSGCTVHLVDEDLDHGPILAQAAVPVLPDDTEASLSARILAEEHRIYAEAVAAMVRGDFIIEGRRIKAGSSIIFANTATNDPAP